MKAIGIILAGGNNDGRLGALTDHRAAAALPVGSCYRAIDFTLSNMSSSGVGKVAALTQYNSRSLRDHLMSSKWWDFGRKQGGLFVFTPTITAENSFWYRGTADAIYQNIPFIERFDPEYVLILSGDHIYKMDYSDMLAVHKRNEADCTIAVLRVSMEDATRFGIMTLDEGGRICRFTEKPKQPDSDLASMGIYIFNWQKLRKYLIEDEAKEGSGNDFGHDVIPAMHEAGERMFAYQFDGYWKDVGTIQSLWEANMDLLGDNPNFDVTDSSWKIQSRSPLAPPHYIGDNAKIDNSIIMSGCEIEGTLENSVLASSVVIGKGAVVKNSIVMQDGFVVQNATLNCVVADKSVVITPNKTLSGAETYPVYIGKEIVI